MSVAEARWEEDWLSAGVRLSSALDDLARAWRLSHRRVLVVDDEADSAEFVCAALRPIPTRCASSASSAAQELRRYRPHVLVTDVRMPPGDGPALAREAMSLPSPPAVILISGIDRDVLDHVGRSVGAAAWFQKPFDPERLRAAVERLLLG